MRKTIVGLMAAVFVLPFLFAFFVTAGCLHTKIEGQGWKMNRWQFFERQDIGTITVESNGVLRVGAYVAGVDTNGLSVIGDIAGKVTKAAVEAGLISGLAMQQNQGTSEQAAPLGRTMRVQSVNGKEGPYDLQFVPVAREPDEAAK